MGVEMRVAVLNRDHRVYPGGDQVHIEELSRELRLLGIKRIYSPQWAINELKSFDFLHLYHLNFNWCYDNYQLACESGVPYVLTCIFYPKLYTLDVPRMRQIVDGASAVVCYSQAEADELERFLGQKATHIIPPGVASRFHNYQGPQYRTGVCTSAGRPGEKNASLIQTKCRKLKLPYKHIYGVPHGLIHNEYFKYRVFVNASNSERFGLTILEALAANCRVLATVHSRGLEHLPGIVTIDPQNTSDLDAKLVSAYDSEGWDFTPNEAARKMSWTSAAMKYQEIYGAAENPITKFTLKCLREE